MSQRSNQIRIIAGEWRGRKLPVIDLPGLRPTTDRVRETLFNWLMHDVAGARCLDLFAGSGALGLECLSRGAKFVQFVESNRQAAQALQSSLTRLDSNETSDRYSISLNQAERFLSVPPAAPFDLIFLDPPFASDALVHVSVALQESAWLAPQAKIYIEQSARAEPTALPSGWSELRSGSAGESRYALYQLD